LLLSLRRRPVDSFIGLFWSAINAGCRDRPTDVAAALAKQQLLCRSRIQKELSNGPFWMQFVFVSR